MKVDELRDSFLPSVGHAQYGSNEVLRTGQLDFTRDPCRKRWAQTEMQGKGLREEVILYIF